MGFQHPLTVADKIQILRLLRSGRHINDIARQLRFKRQTVSEVIQAAAVAWINGVEANQRVRELMDRED